LTFVLGEHAAQACAIALLSTVGKQPQICFCKLVDRVIGREHTPVLDVAVVYERHDSASAEQAPL
jgi:hypothetical protein